MCGCSYKECNLFCLYIFCIRSGWELVSAHLLSLQTFSGFGQLLIHFYLPGGGPQGTLLGLFLFLVLINDAGFEGQENNAGEVLTSKRNMKKVNRIHLKYVRYSLGPGPRGWDRSLGARARAPEEWILWARSQSIWYWTIPGQRGSHNDNFMPFFTLLDPTGNIF